jgi:hypothetical protein
MRPLITQPGNILRGPGHSNTAETYFSILKRGIGGKRLTYRRTGEGAHP